MMKRKSFLGRVAIIAMALTLATTSMMSGTLARYETTRTTTPYALVARWAPEVKLNSQTFSTTVDLAATATHTTDASQASEIGTTTSRAIAPGTKGELKIDVDVANVDVPVLVNIAAVKNDSYVFPGHLVVYVTNANGGTQYGSAMIGKYVASVAGSPAHYEVPFDVESGKCDIVGGTQKALLFKSARQGGTTRNKQFVLHWEWPLEYSDYQTAVSGKLGSSTLSMEASSAYNGFDADDGAGSNGGTTVTNESFGFDLQITLTQQTGTLTSGSYDEA